MSQTNVTSRPTFSVATQLIERAAELYDIDPWEIMRLGKQRQRFRPRWAVIWTLRQLNPPSASPNAKPYSYERIARLLGFEDHTTVMYGRDQAEALRKLDPKFQELTDDLLAYAQTLGPQIEIKAA